MAYSQSTPPAPTVTRAPIWPLFLAPLVAGIYYLALRQGFALSLASVVADASDVASHQWDAPKWGSHWIYRSFAEIVSVPFGTFVAAGIAQQRAKLGGIIGGLAISLGYLLRNSILLFAVVYMRPEDYRVIEPWYQHVIEGLVIVGAPFVGSFMADAANDMIHGKPEGFAGINRWHFLWLWFAAMAYAGGVISPLLHMWIGSLMYGGGGDIIRTIVFGLPVVTYAIPALWGLAVLAHESSWSRRKNNIVGPLILIVGWFLATAIVSIWGWLVATVLQAVFG